MQRGFWNIPVRRRAREVRPDVALAPVVGFDAAGYRLGYGGGYFDRTLAALGSPVEHVLHPLGQLGQGEGLGQEGGVRDAALAADEASPRRSRT